MGGGKGSELVDEGGGTVRGTPEEKGPGGGEEGAVSRCRRSWSNLFLQVVLRIRHRGYICASRSRAAVASVRGAPSGEGAPNGKHRSRLTVSAVELTAVTGDTATPAYGNYSRTLACQRLGICPTTGVAEKRGGGARFGGPLHIESIGSGNELSSLRTSSSTLNIN